MINQFKCGYKYGIPLAWWIFFLLLLLTSLSLFFIPDSWLKGAFTQFIGIGAVFGLFGGFVRNKHPLLPWGFLLLGSFLFGTSLTLVFLSKSGLPISSILIALLVEIGVILIFVFSFSVLRLYEKRLHLSGFIVDLGLLILTVIIFSLFIHPTLLNTFIYDLDFLKKVYFTKIVFSILIIFMSILINVLYRGRRVQLLLLLPMSFIMLAQFLSQHESVLNFLGNQQYYSPLSSELFVLSGVLAGIFNFTESFSDQAIAENHLEIQKIFTQFSNALMWTATIFAVIAIPIAIIIRIIFSLPEISLLITMVAILVLSLIIGVRLVSLIKASQEQQKKLLSITQTDKLTGLLNYLGFYDCLLKKDVQTLLLVIINIDDFKSVNDYYGRKFGDQVLITLARKLNKISGSISCSRLSTDNFIIAFQVEQNAAKKRITALTKELGTWNTVLNKKVAVSLTFGACYLCDAKTLETKIGYAELALATARTQHVNYYLFKKAENKQALPRHELQEILQQAIDNDYLPVHFQPIYNLHDGSLKALELLIRVASTQYGILLPAQFLAQAQAYGLLVALTKVCISMVAHYWDQLPNVIININLPPFILKKPKILRGLVEHIKALGLDPRQLCFEITEDENIRADHLITQVKYLTDQHFTIAMDDFGTGYSSLERLSFLTFDTIKIDRSLLLAASNGNKTILEGSIGLIKRLGESVVVEGVETVEQLRLIKKLGADAVQGFLLSKPIPIAKIAQLPRNISQVVAR